MPMDYPFLYKTMPRRGIVIPFTHNNQIVGSTIRFLDDRTPKYINDIQHGYVFGTDLQHDAWQYAIVVEGIFDALSINGCALTHNTINDNQADLLNDLNRKIIFVPDRDKTGLDSCDRALELGYSVSIPHWADDIKDVNDAVCKLGRLATLYMITQAKESNALKIRLNAKKWFKDVHENDN